MKQAAKTDAHEPTPATGDAGTVTPQPYLFVVIFAAALLLRAVYLYDIHDADWFSLYIGDGQVYHQWAMQLAAGDWLGDHVFYQAPLYPYFLGVIYTLLGHDPLTLRMVQITLGACACGLLALTAARLGCRRAGWITGTLAALYPQAIYFDTLIQKAVLDFFCFSLMLFAIACAVRAASVWRWALVGAATALLMLTRENAAALALVLVAWVIVSAWRRRGAQGSARAWAKPTVLVVGLAVVLLPVATRNAVVGGEFHLTSSQMGSNLYIGNNPSANGSYMSLRPSRGHADFERIDATELAAEGLGVANPSPRQVSRYWLGKTLEYIRGQPGHWLKLMGRKAWLLVDAVERADTESIYAARRSSPLVWGVSSIYSFGVLLALAAVGAIIVGVRKDGVALIYTLTIVYGLSVIAFFVFDRYRHPLAAPLLVTAGCGLALAGKWWSAAPLRSRVVTIACTSILVIITHWPTGVMAEQRATAELAIANELLLQKHDNPAAIAHVRASLEAKPSAAAYSKLGVLLMDDNPQEAEAMFRQAIELYPRFGEARRTLGMLLANTGRADEAIEHLTVAVDVYAQDFVALYHLGVAYDRKHDPATAADLYIAALLAADQPAKADVCLRTIRGHPYRLQLSLQRLRTLAAEQPSDEKISHYLRVLQGG